MTEEKVFSGLPDELGEYTLLSELRADGRGRVLLLYDRVCRRKAVLKTAYDDPALHETEAAVMSELAGEGVPVVYGCFPSGNGGLLREYVPGETLDEYVREKGALGTEEVISLGIALCRIIGRMHRHEPQIVHRDIKPQNIVRKSDGSPVIIDFGTCREYDASSSRDTQVIGTPVSAPPEQFGYRQTDARSDVYSIGVLLNFLSTGEYSPDKLTAGSRLKPIIEKCTSFSPDARYYDAAELQRALESLLPSARLRGRILLCAAAVVAAAVIAPLAVRGISSATPTAVTSETELPSVEPPRDEAYKFADAAIEAEVCRQLGKDTISLADLSGITELMLIGNTPIGDWDALSFVGDGVAVNGVGIDERGGVFTLEDIAAMPNLHTLALCNQKISDLSPLAGSKIERLALHGNSVSDITPLSQCVSLSELVIGGNPVSVLTPLLDCGQLSALEIGKTRVSDFEVISRLPELSELNIVMCDYLTDFSPLAEMDGLRVLEIFPADKETMDIICGITGLVNLVVWCSDDVEDFEGISKLKNLQSLLIGPLGDKTVLSFDGIEKLPRLYYMFVGGAKGSDISALGKSQSLSCVIFENCDIEDYSALAEIEGLQDVECSAAEYDKISAALAGKDTVVTVK